MAASVKSQTDRSALILGVGYSARALIPLLKAEGFEIAGTVRNPQKAENLSKLFDIRVVATDRLNNTALLNEMVKATHLISSIPPSDNGQDPVMTGLGPDIIGKFPRLRWAAYMSATSVYGDRGGQWAFEDELLRPGTRRGLYRANAEMAWIESGLPVHIFRLAGIYGPDLKGRSRNAFERLQSGQVRAVIKPGHVVNRIHVLDLAEAVLASIKRPDPLRIYNIADGNPAPPQHVMEFAAGLIGAPPPRRIDFDKAVMTPMAKSFYKETKRIDISRARRELAWEPKYSDFRKGLLDIYRETEFDAKTVCLAGHLRVPYSEKARIETALKKHIGLTRKEAGCLRFDVWKDEHDQEKFHVVEAFRSKKDFAVHQNRSGQSEWGRASRHLERSYTVVGYEVN